MRKLQKLPSGPCEQSHCLSEVQKLLQQVRAAQASLDGLWEWNLLTDEVWCSSRLLELTSHSERRNFASIAGWLDTIDVDDRENIWTMLQNALASSGAFETECRLAARDGSTHWFRIRGSVYCEEDGRQVYLSGTLQPLDDLKRAQAQLRDQETQLLQKQKMEAIGLLAGGVAHEFNNLLQSIRGYTSFACETLDPESPASKDLEKVLRAADRAARLTRGLLDFSHTNPFQERSCSLNQVVEESLQLLRPLLPVSVALRQVVADKDIVVNCDPQSLQQLVSNLCINARDAMSQGGELLVRSDAVWISPKMVATFPGLKMGWHARILVSDTGKGIPAEIQDKIYEPFFTTKGIGEGSGLGLSIVHGIVRQSDGHITFHSVPGRGTTFRVYLPLNQVNRECCVASAPATESTGKPILVAIPDAAARSMGCRVLQQAGYPTLAARNVSEFRSYLTAQAGQISLVVIDEQFSPDLDRDVLDFLIVHFPDVQVCLCTRFDPQSALCSKKFPVIEHLEYPLIEQDLTQIVSAALQNTQDLMPVTVQ
jgi:signal transduction histidine kinase